MKKLVSGLLLWMWFAGYVVPLQAQTPQPAIEVSAKDKEKAKSLFSQGQKYYGKKQYLKALEKYQEAYKLLPNPNILFNIGQCYRFLDKYRESKQAYEQYLKEAPDSPVREEVEEHIRTLNKKIAELPPETQPTIPETQPTKLPTSQPKSLPTTEPVSQPATEPVSKPTTEPTTEPGITPFVPIDPVRNYWLYGSGGAAAVGVVFGGLALNRFRLAKELQERDEVSVQLAEREVEIAVIQGRRRAMVCDLFLVGAVGSGVMGYLHYNKTKKQSKETTKPIKPIQQVQFTISGGSILLQGEF